MVWALKQVAEASATSGRIRWEIERILFKVEPPKGAGSSDGRTPRRTSHRAWRVPFDVSAQKHNATKNVLCSIDLKAYTQFEGGGSDDFSGATTVHRDTGAVTRGHDFKRRTDRAKRHNSGRRPATRLGDGGIPGRGGSPKRKRGPRYRRCDRTRRRAGIGRRGRDG